MEILFNLTSGFLLAEPIPMKCDLEVYYLPNLSTKYPNREPRIMFIIRIGIKLAGSCHPTINANGTKSVNEIATPFIAPFSFMFVEETRKFHKL